MASTTVTSSPATVAGPVPARRAGRLLAAAVAATLALITAAAAVLRLLHLGAVVGDPFYDAAVRSMGLSWHNFFFGAFEPSGSVSIDKPPLDLWLQVVSVKLFGFGSLQLKLPEALAGVLAVPLLFLALRFAFGDGAALAAALALALLPIEVLTARSDTMDALMMALLVVALAGLASATRTGRTAALVLAAVALGLAFNVKLLESAVALPGLAVIALLGLPGSARRRLGQLALAVVVYVAVALSWLSATLLFPAHDRPFAIGSTNGSAWNAAFVFNGLDRAGASNGTGARLVYGPAKGSPTATQAQRDAIPITAPSATRLLTGVGPLSGERLGLEVLAALLLGGPALALLLVGEVRRRRRSRAPADPRTRTRVALAAGLLVWLVAGIVLFSAQARLHPRYVEAFTPAVAAVLGVGAVWATTGSGPRRVAWLAVALAVIVVYEHALLYGSTTTWWIAAAAAVLAVVCAAAASAVGAGRRRLWPALAVAAAAGTLGSVLSVSLQASITLINARTSDAGHVGALQPVELQRLSAFLLAHQGSARYEVAAASATAVGGLIVEDVRPVLVLTTYNARTLTPVARLRALIAAGEVRYALLNTLCGRHTPRTDAACSAPALWVRAHGIDVSAQAGLPHERILWLLPRSSG